MRYLLYSIVILIGQIIITTKIDLEWANDRIQLIKLFKQMGNMKPVEVLKNITRTDLINGTVYEDIQLNQIDSIPSL